MAPITRTSLEVDTEMEPDTNTKQNTVTHKIDTQDRQNLVEHDVDMQEQTEKSVEMILEVGDYVAAIYDETWYIGKLIDKHEDDYEVTFMKKKKCCINSLYRQIRYGENVRTLSK